MDSPPPFHAPVTAERHSDSSGDRPSTCHRRDLRTRFKTVSRLVMADFSGDLRPDFAIDIEPVKPGRVWRCAAIRCWCWSQCLGLRWNLRNTRRFASWQMCATFIYCFLGVFFNVYMVSLPPPTNV